MSEQLAEGIHISKNSGAVYRKAFSLGSHPGYFEGEYPLNGFDPFPGQLYQPVFGDLNGAQIAYWGLENLEPYRLLTLLKKNNIAPTLLVNLVFRPFPFRYKEKKAVNQLFKINRS